MVLRPHLMHVRRCLTLLAKKRKECHTFNEEPMHTHKGQWDMREGGGTFKIGTSRSELLAILFRTLGIRIASTIKHDSRMNT